MSLSNRIPLRVREFWRRNHVTVLILPALLGLAFGAYVFFRALDPRLGVEGFGDLFAYVVNAVRAAMIVAAVWWFKKHAWFDLHTPTELELFEKSRAGDRNAERLLWRDRIEWAFLLVLAAWLFTR